MEIGELKWKNIWKQRSSRGHVYP